MPRVSRSFHRPGLIVLTAAWIAASACGSSAPAGAGDADAPVCQDLTADRPDGTPHHLRLARQAMGTAFEIRVVTADALQGCAAMEAAFGEIERQEALFSEYRESSDISAINREAGRAAVDVSPEVFGLINHATALTRATGGAFDITFAACGRLWSIRERRMPDEASLTACLREVGAERIRLDSRHSSVFLPGPAMRIGVGAIAKGYGVDRAADVLMARGITRFAVDGGGDLRVQGEDIDGPWTVRVAHPREPGRVLRTLHLDRGAIVTSGDYLRFFEQDGVRYHHILDPATGMPARRTISVTVVAETATDADALATGLFVMGPERGLEALGRLPGVEALFVAPDLSVRASPGFPADGAAAPRASAH